MIITKKYLVLSEKNSKKNHYYEKNICKKNNYF